MSIGIKPARCEGKCKECTGCAKKPIDIRNEAFLANTVVTKLLPISLVGEVRKHSDLIQDASPYLLYRFKHDLDGHLFTVGGFDPANDQAVGTTCCAKGDITEGVFIKPGDSGLVLLEQGYAVGHGLKTGDSVLVASETFRAAGIVNPGVRPAKADIYMIFHDAERVINRRIKSPLLQEMNILLVQVTDSQKQEAAIEKVKSIMQEGVATSYACYKPAVEVMGMNEMSVWLISVVLGMGAVFLSMKSQLASVVERRHDIGILKAIGWTNNLVVRQILLESGIQAFLGGILGCTTGVILIYFVPIKAMIGIQARLDPSVSPIVLISALFLAAIGGITAGALPAWSAARQNPADELRRP